MTAALRRLLFALPPETAHDIASGALAAASRCARLYALLRHCHRGKQTELPHQVMGLSFPNPVGLAAGFDKQGAACNALDALGFGWLELGTVTPKPQPGNPKPRLFRLNEQRALINRMGFNSNGLARFCRNLERADSGIIKGVNIGKNAATALAQAGNDYLACLEAVYPHADYIALNISSPNTESLRDLQRADALAPLLRALDKRRMALADAHGRRAPLALKIAPDLEADALDVIAELARRHHIDGIAATNTTLSRAAVDEHQFAHEPGGLSGPPLAAQSTATVAHLYRNLQGEIPIIGVGGIDSADDAIDKFQAGADLVQIYTGFIYHGPRLIRDIIARLCRDIGEGQDLRDFLVHLRAATPPPPPSDAE